MSKSDISIALLHYPVLNKNGETGSSAVTNLDIHDIARLARTYGLKNYYIVTPLQDQKSLVKKIVEHWTVNKGGQVNPDRKEALGIVKICDSIEDVKNNLLKDELSPVLISTTAVKKKGSIEMETLKEMISDKGKHFLIILGTAWGLAEEIFEKSDYVLEPVETGSDYNHLSVRSAAAIIIDRLLSDR
ncbi:MAG: RNA methyltransferase [Thermodesulfobacteriota bacterium]